jgi:hypothetical protein
LTRHALRIDFTHGGSQHDEAYVVVSAVQCTRADPHVAGALDARGGYRWAVEDAHGALVASRGFSTLFEEWQSTVVDSAEPRCADFKETHVVPWYRGGRLRIERRQREGFMTVFECALPETAALAPSPPPRELRLLHGAAGATFLLVSEGYAIGDGERFFVAARHACEVLLSTSPFAEHASELRIAALFVPCAGPGIPGVHGAHGDATNFASAYGTFGMARYLVCRDLHALHRAVDGVAWDSLVVLADGSTYGGSGIFNSNACVAAGMDAFDFRYVLPHELGHSYGGLGDEYFGKPVSYSVADEDPWDAWEPNVCTLGQGRPAKWADRIGSDVPVPTPWQHKEFCTLLRDVTDVAEQRERVARLLQAEPFRDRLGVFEGARYRERGMFRPEVDCRMFSKSARRFCAVCHATLADMLRQAVPARQ